MVILLIILIIICMFPNTCLLAVALGFWGLLTLLTRFLDLFRKPENKVLKSTKRKKK